MSTGPFNVPYQVYPGQQAASTKVLHLSRPAEQTDQGQFHGQVYATQPAPSQYYSTSSQQQYALQPQVFTVGGSSPYSQVQAPTPQQQYRVMTTSKPDGITPSAGYSPTNVAYYSPQAQVQHQRVYEPTQQNQYQTYNNQQQQQQQPQHQQQPIQYSPPSEAPWAGQPQVWQATNQHQHSQQQQQQQQQQQKQSANQVFYTQPASQHEAQTNQVQQYQQKPAYSVQATNQYSTEAQPINVAQPIGGQTANQASYFNVHSVAPPNQIAYNHQQQSQPQYQQQYQQRKPSQPQQYQQSVHQYRQQQQQQQNPPPQQVPVQPKAPQAQHQEKSYSTQQAVRTRTPSIVGGFKAQTLPLRSASSVDTLNSMEPPHFAAQPTPQITVNEGDPILLSARVTPAGDSTLKVEWYKDGKALTAASRFTTSFERGYSVLEFLYTNEIDAGTYFCVANNAQGQAQSSVSTVTVIPEEGVITETQLPEESMVANLAAMEDQMYQDGLSRSARYRDDNRSIAPPTFLKALAPQLGLKETDAARFETVVEPASDSSLCVEWFKDGQPVSTGCRFTTSFDRGFASLDIHYCYPEDSGAYFCVAKNSVGQAQSNVVDLQCQAAETIITGSLLSQDSVNYLQSLDNWHSDIMAGYDTMRIEEQEPPAAPSFDILPVTLTVTEGSPAKFLVKAGGFPRPKVFWYMNDELMPSHGGSGNWRIYQDGGISQLEIHRVGVAGENNIRVVARNQHGESAADTQLIIQPQADFRPGLRHVEPENPFRKLAQLRKVTRSDELNHAFQRTKPHAINLRRLERESEAKGRSVADQEALETENLYSRVQAQLRSHRPSSLPPPTPPPVQKQQEAPRQAIPPSQTQPIQQRAGAPTPQPRPGGIQVPVQHPAPPRPAMTMMSQPQQRQDQPPRQQVPAAVTPVVPAPISAVPPAPPAPPAQAPVLNSMQQNGEVQYPTSQ